MVGLLYCLRYARERRVTSGPTTTILPIELMLDLLQEFKSPQISIILSTLNSLTIQQN